MVKWKLRRLANILTKKTIIVGTEVGNTEEFKMNKGVYQGDSLSVTWFNLALAYITTKMYKENVRR